MVSPISANNCSLDSHCDTQFKTTFAVNGSCGCLPEKNGPGPSNSAGWEFAPEKFAVSPPASSTNILRLPPPTPRGPTDSIALPSSQALLVAPEALMSPCSQSPGRPGASQRPVTPQRPWTATRRSTPTLGGSYKFADLDDPLGAEIPLASPRSPSGPSTAATSATLWSSSRSVECCSPQAMKQGGGSPVRRAESQTMAVLEARLGSPAQRLGRDGSAAIWRIAETRLGQLERGHNHAKAELDAQLVALRAARAHMVASAQPNSALRRSAPRRADAPRQSPRRPLHEEQC